jgi:hypothetical protein
MILITEFLGLQWDWTKDGNGETVPEKGVRLFQTGADSSSYEIWLVDGQTMTLYDDPILDTLEDEDVEGWVSLAKSLFDKMDVSLQFVPDGIRPMPTPDDPSPDICYRRLSLEEIRMENQGE